MDDTTSNDGLAGPFDIIHHDHDNDNDHPFFNDNDDSLDRLLRHSPPPSPVITHHNHAAANDNAIFFRHAVKPDGTRVQIRTRSRFAIGSRLSSTITSSSPMHNSIDITAIMDQIQKDQDKLSQQKQEQQNAPGPVADHDSNNNNSNVPPASSSDDQLWVEKWRANKWIDLLGDERTHRSILHWLQQWSPSVFKTSPAKPKPQPQPAQKIADDNDSFAIDPLHRPHKKILLVHGSPGLGKTTVAHVAARQAGYDVLEINASHERGGAAVADKVRAALESHRVANNKMARSARPVCIVVDEIDGSAESGFIRCLLDILAADAKAIQYKGVSKPSSSSSSLARRRRGAHQQRDNKFLLRPIIAICNDPYVSALRMLRPLTELVHYKRATTNAIVSRLQSICANEKIMPVVDRQVLTDLVNAMDGDVRSCINTLQFELCAATTTTTTTTTDLVKTSRLKDVATSANAVVASVFSSTKPASSLTRAQRLQALVDMIERNAEFDKIMTACFAMYPTMSYTSDMLQTESRACEWLYFFDRLSHAMHHHDHHRDLASYLAFPVAGFNALFASSSSASSSLNRPTHFVINTKQDYDAFETIKSNRDLCKQLVRASSLQRLLSQMDIVPTEFAPYLIKIINPAITTTTPSTSSSSSAAAVNSHERDMIHHAVEVLRQTDIKLYQQRAGSGVFVYRMDPPLEQIVTFADVDRDRAAAGKFMVRQLMAQELSRLHNSVNTVTTTTKRSLPSQQQNTTQNNNRKRQAVSANPGGLQSAKSTSTMSAFFKPKPTPTLTVATPSSQTTQAKSEHQHTVWIQFHEGFSNAVRKPISWSDFWRSI
ncbi:P-loop containing nucleoside triphosphate hydrolase protein [Lipomyces japonicus]|uniref:P-loop containing nucleoside triphosphate hydrolase protein n=1 Tax=Lipomyces japonicus TaxID=56871 RepID=UPI0034CFFEAE